MSKDKKIYAWLTEDQYNLARRKLFVEDLTWQAVVPALINAYIMGDVSVTRQGRYHLAPPSNYVPIVEIPKGSDVVEIEPAWGKSEERPQVGATEHRQQPRKAPQDRWGTRELTMHLKQVTGRKLSQQIVRLLLRELEIPKSDRGRWYFKGANDPHVLQVKEAIEEGRYDEITRLGAAIAEERRLRKQSELDEFEEAKELTEEQRRIQHLKRLRKIEEQK